MRNVANWMDHIQNLVDQGAVASRTSPGPVIARFGELAEEYRALAHGPALVDRSERGLLEITGADRASWLHNLTTNQVKTLAPGDGQYAFALNVKGRILFDVNLLIRAESIWVDIDRRFLEIAQSHFDKYLITEDATISDRSDEFVRLALVGDRAVEMLAGRGLSNAGQWPILGSAEMLLDDAVVPLIRHDFCGPFGVELFVPSSHAVTVWNHLTDSSHNLSATPVGCEAVEIHRIEAGLPWPGHEITNEYLPAETGQSDRAVSHHKGCYLGQEIVERMRSRDVVARKLVGIEWEGKEMPPRGAPLLDDEGSSMGVMTSVCRCVARDAVIALGYAKSTASRPETIVVTSWEKGKAKGVVAKLPFTAAPIR